MRNREKLGIKKAQGIWSISAHEWRLRVQRRNPRTIGRVSREKLFTGNITEAKKALAAMTVELEEALKADNAPVVDKAMVLGDYARQWVSSKSSRLSMSTKERYADALENHIMCKGALGEFLVNRLRAKDVQAWVDRGTEKYSIATVRGWFRVLRSMLRAAMTELGITVDPTAGIEWPERVASRGKNSLSADQAVRFLEALRTSEVHHKNHALAMVLMMTSLRFNHASALQWSDIDFDEGVIRVKRSQVRGHVAEVNLIKKAPEEVALHPDVAEALKLHRLWLIKTQNRGLEAGWCFPTRNGTLKVPGNLHKAWVYGKKAIGLTERFTPHGCRRTFNNLSRKVNGDIVTRSMTGHVSASMTEHYSSVSLEEKQAAVINIFPVRSVNTDGSVNTGRVSQ